MSSMMWMMVAGLGAELLLLLLVVLTVSFFRNRAQHRRDQQAAKALVARVKKSKPEREQAIAEFLEQGMGLSGDQLAQAKVAMLRAELSLLQRFAGVYRQREASLAARFDDELVAALAPYHDLKGSAAGSDRATEAVDEQELERLRADNKRLSEELSITMETMSRMLNEYSTMFAGNSVDDAAPIAVATGAAAVVAEDSKDEVHPDDDEADIALADSAEDADSQVDIEVEVPEQLESVEADAGAPDQPEEHGELEVMSAEPDEAEEASASLDEPVDDEIAEIMRAAQAQEAQAKGPVDDEGGQSDITADSAFEEGPSEVLEFDEVEIAGSDLDAADVDDLFDSADPDLISDNDDVDDIFAQVAGEVGEGSDEAAPSKTGSAG
ncbi:MAG: hypothetical protein KDI82_12535 [Gammaproteobacteria bacterium]|nr:hypothetical protein [Gammaproteobacteria bacterium]